jgi:hypothetical protein
MDSCILLPKQEPGPMQYFALKLMDVECGQANLNWQPIGNQNRKIAQMKKPGRFRTGLSH